MATKASRIALAGSNISSTGEVDADLLDNIDSAAFLSLDGNGRLGIGTSSPISQLHVNKNVAGHNTDGITLGKVESAGWIDVNEEMGRLSWSASYGSSYTPGIGAYISAKADANWDGTETPTRLGFFTAPEGSTTPVERMRVNSLGNVGIGTSSMEGSAAAIKVEVESGSNYRPMRLRFTDDNNGSTNNPLSFEYKAGLEIENIYSGAAPSANGTKIAKLSLTTVTSSGYGATGSIFVTTNAGTGHNSGELAFAVGHNSSGLETEAMRINKDGNVGIGTSAPLADLHVQGNAVIGNIQTYETTNPANSGATLHVHNTADDGGDADGEVNFGDETQVIISTGAIAGGPQGYQGSLWFGTSDHPAGGNTLNSAGTQWNWKVAGIASKTDQDTASENSAYGNLEFYTKGSNASTSASLAMTIDESQNVGIGTDDPQDKLHISGASENIRLHNTGTGNYGLEIWRGSNKGASIAWGEGNANLEIKNYRNDSQADGPYANIDFFTGGTNANASGSPAYSPDLRMRIQQTGEVGIGTSNPQQMLHIAGSSPQIMLEDTDASGTPYSKISGVNGHIYLQADEGNELANTAIHFKVDAQEHMTLYDNGMLSLNYGTNGGWEGATSMPSLIINQSDAHRGIALRTVGNSNVGPTFSLERTRASGAETQHADYLGNIRFNGTTGSYIGRVGAGIEAQQRGSVVGGYAPGRLKFMTTATTATHNGQNPSTGSYAARMVINPGGDQLINGQFNHHVISGTSSPNVAFQYDFYRATYAHPMKITCAISHWNGGYMSYTEGFYWGFNTAMSSNVLHSYNGGNGSWTISFPTNDIVRVRMNGDASYGYGSGWYIKLEGNLRREYTTA